MELKLRIQCDCDGRKEIKEEEVIGFLTEIRNDIGVVDRRFNSKSLQKVLQVIEGGEYEVHNLNVTGVVTVIDLSQINNLFKDYRAKSEGGCYSCSHLVHKMPSEGEHLFYCGLTEDKSSIGESREFSIKIEAYRDKGCQDRKPIKRPLSKILEGR